MVTADEVRNKQQLYRRRGERIQRSGERERATLSVRPRAPYLRRWAFFSSLLATSRTVRPRGPGLQGLPQNPRRRYGTLDSHRDGAGMERHYDVRRRVARDE